MLRSLIIAVAILSVLPVRADDTDVAVALALAKAKVLAISKKDELPVPPPVKTDPDDTTVWSYEDGSARAKESGKTLVTWVGYEDPSTAIGFVTCSARQLVGFPEKCVIVSVWSKGRHAGVVVSEADAGNSRRIQEIASQLSR